MGSVYRAEDEHLGVAVAVKENLFLSDEYSRQFQREARILAGMRHPSLPRVMDYFTITGQGQYLVMDFIDGEDLRQRIERLGMLHERDVILIGAVVCNALTYLHTRPSIIIHRDIKPGNIKITPEGQVVLVDFGLAKIMQESENTSSGARAMTPGYSPPEQYGTAPTDSRSDIYSLGATLYAALTGVIPEDGLMRMTHKAVLTPLRQLRPDVTYQTIRVIEKALAIESVDRYQTATEFKQALLEAGDVPQITQQRLNGNPLLADKAALLSENVDLSPDSTSQENPVLNRLINWLSPAFRFRWALVLLPILVLAGAAMLATSQPSVRPPTPIVLAEPTPAPSGTSLPAVSTTLTLTATVTQSPSSTPTPTTPPSATPTIIRIPRVSFVSDRTGSAQVWISALDGSGQRQVTNLSDGACQPSWSPDGKKLAVISPCSIGHLYQDARIYILDENGQNPQLLPRTEKGDYDPAWSPDGTRLAFTSQRTGIAHIYMYNFSDNTFQELSDTRYPDSQPAWNPVGMQLAFVRKNIFSHIWLMSDKGLTQFQFSSNGEVSDSYPEWSPDGKYILFTRTTTNGIPHIVRLSYEQRGTAGENNLPPTTNKDAVPAANSQISADGQWIIYESWPDGHNHDIYMMDKNGENLVRLTSDPGYDFSPTFQYMIQTAP